MGADGDKLIGVFVTVDPERGTPEQTAAAAKEFKVFYTRQPGQTPTSYTIDHTVASFVFDPKGRLRLYVRHAAPPAEAAADLKVLLAEKA